MFTVLPYNHQIIGTFLFTHKALSSVPEIKLDIPLRFTVALHVPECALLTRYNSNEALTYAGYART
jgi:hypothetical protein